MEQKRKYKVELNSVDNIRELLQEIYHEAEEQKKLAIDESVKLTNSTKLTEEIMDGKSKYCKAQKDYMDIKQKAMDLKLDIAKLLTEIYKQNGNVKAAVVEAKQTKSLSPDFFKAIKAEVENSVNNGTQKETYKL